MTYLIYCKNFCKCHSVPPLSTKNKKGKKERNLNYDKYKKVSPWNWISVHILKLELPYFIYTVCTYTSNWKISSFTDSDWQELFYFHYYEVHLHLAIRYKHHCLLIWSPKILFVGVNWGKWVWSLTSWIIRHFQYFFKIPYD
jgi:hypothetical protein